MRAQIIITLLIVTILTWTTEHERNIIKEKYYKYNREKKYKNKLNEKEFERRANYIFNRKVVKDQFYYKTMKHIEEAFEIKESKRQYNGQTKHEDCDEVTNMGIGRYTDCIGEPRICKIKAFVQSNVAKLSGGLFCYKFDRKEETLYDRNNTQIELKIKLMKSEQIVKGEGYSTGYLITPSRVIAGCNIITQCSVNWNGDPNWSIPNSPVGHDYRFQYTVPRDYPCVGGGETKMCMLANVIPNKAFQILNTKHSEERYEIELETNKGTKKKI